MFPMKLLHSRSYRNEKIKLGTKGVNTETKVNKYLLNMYLLFH